MRLCKRLQAAIAFIIIVIVIITSPTRAVAISIIGGMLALWALCDKKIEEKGDKAPTTENYWPLPGGHPPHLVGEETERAIPPARYPGAFSDGESAPADEPAVEEFTPAPKFSPKLARERYPGAVEEFEELTATGPFLGTQSEEYADRSDAEGVPEGNPYDASRLSAPKAAGPCIDDEADDSELDFDERNTYQARSRNDETRVAAGTMRRLRELKPYLEEELQVAENREWMGRHEW